MQYRTLLLLLFTGIFYAHGQTTPNSAQVYLRYFAGNSDGKEVLLHNKTHKMLPGGHLQGVGVINNGGVVLTASSGSWSYYLTGYLRQGEITGMVKLLPAPFKHAGGCQMANNRLAVGIEDNAAKNQSVIMVIDFNDSLKEIRRNIVATRSGSFKRSTAGAVGMAQLADSTYLLVVGDWDSRNIDFYKSRTEADTVFDSLTTLQPSPGLVWGSYQSINLLTPARNQLYMVGFCKAGHDNRADIFKLEMEAGALKATFVKSITCFSKRSSFRFAAGMGIENNEIVIYATPRKLGRYGIITRFK